MCYTGIALHKTMEHGVDIRKGIYGFFIPFSGFGVSLARGYAV
jgi:hypothetical protein